MNNELNELTLAEFAFKDCWLGKIIKRLFV